MTPKTLAEMVENIANKNPASVWGDTAAAVCMLAAALAGIDGRGKIKTITFGDDATPDDSEAPSISERLINLADEDIEVENAVRDALRIPAMIPSQRESRRTLLNEKYTAAVSAATRLLDVCGEAAEVIAADDSRSDILTAQRAAALSLCIGAMQALKAEILLRISRISDEAAAANLLKENEQLCERYISSAESTRDDALCSLKNEQQQRLL